VVSERSELGVLRTVTMPIYPLTLHSRACLHLNSNFNEMVNSKIKI
jgi:hypothetical protein